eukprot:scaffold81429_cov59-Phaeocystis_antarctica.AAC.3
MRSQKRPDLLRDRRAARGALRQRGSAARAGEYVATRVEEDAARLLYYPLVQRASSRQIASGSRHLLLRRFGRSSERSSSFMTTSCSRLATASGGMGGTTSSLKYAPGGMGGATSSSLTYAPGGMGGTAPSSLRTAPAGMAGALPLPSSSLSAAATSCPSGDRAMHRAASSAVAKLPRVICLPPRLTFAW